jgi:two-component system, NarL family, sensor kinase
MRQVVRCAALIGGALVLAGLALTAQHATDSVKADPTALLGQLSAALVFGFVGVAVAERAEPPASRIGWLLGLVGLCQAATFATTSYLSGSGAAAGRPLVAWLDGWLWAPAVLSALAVLPLVYPTGAALPAFRGWVAVALTVVVAGSGTAAYGALPGARLPGWAGPLLVAATALCVLAGLVALAVAYRRGMRRLRGQVRWLLWAIVVVAAVEAAVPVLPEGVARIALVLVPLLVPVAVGLAVLRYGLFDIDLLLSRTLVYLGLSAGLAALYAAVLLILDRHLPGATVDRGGFLAVLVVALVASPLREALQRLARRRFFGPAADRQRALAALMRQVGSSPSVRESPAIVVQAVSSALRAPVALVVGTSGSDRVVASTGDVRAPWTEVHVRHSGRPVGALRLARRPAGPLEPREEQMLSDVAVAVGPLLDSLLLAEELREAHARLEGARETERTRLHRDLHDGLGPSLAGLTLGIDAARNLAQRDPAAAERTLARLGELAGAATAEVRRVVDGLRPTVLDRHGLVGAIRQHAELSDSSPRISVEAPDELPLLSRELEDGLLKVVLEAVTNVRRHAGADTCEVLLRTSPGCLEITVDDDGRGLPPVLDGPGIGIPSMRDRVRGLGGAIDFGASTLGGTRVLVRLPLASEAGL